jgi:hypothetical protein
MLYRIILSISLLFTGPIYAFTHSLKNVPIDLIHSQYQNLWEQAKKQGLFVDGESAQAINGGEKLAKWIAFLNSRREDDDKIYLTSPDTRHGSPIDKPNIYGPQQIKAQLAGILEQLPQAMKSIVYGNDELTDKLPIEIDKFIFHARKINHLYQTAVRWEVVIKPQIDWYTKRSEKDVRGYYNLKNLKNLDDVLANYFNLEKKLQSEIKNSLIMICRNSHIKQQDCELSFKKAITGDNKLVQFKNTYWQNAKANWDGFFNITNPRSDITWHDNTMSMPFKIPDSNLLQQWLKENVEDEFVYHGWHFVIDFVTNAKAYLKFEPNITPHVIWGNIIVMDETTDIEEYEVKWTIRHEYGHILRLPDCYVEFFDVGINAAVNYQLDIDDLMCSRAGNMNKRIYDELRRVYTFRK